MINPLPKLYVEVADTPEKQARGLMFVKSMPKDKGMLFAFNRSQQLSFWGENTFIPLDIAFVNKDGIIRNIDRISPLNKKPVRSSGSCQYAIEANAGFFDEHKIKVGDVVKLQDCKSGNGTCVCFEKRKTASVGIPTKTSQLMSNDYGFTMEDAQREAEEQAEQRYNSLPVISPDDIQDILVDEDKEVQPQQIVEQPSEMPAPVVPEKDLEPLPPQTESVPQFDNVFDAVEEFAKPTSQNGFDGKAMRISYITKSGKSIDREVEPHGTFHADSTGNEILVTYDRTAGGIRAFIMQNIKAFALLSDTFEAKFRVEG